MKSSSSNGSAAPTVKSAGGRSWSEAYSGEQSAWRPYLWPLKSLVPLTAVLLMIQGTSEILKSWFAMRTGRAFEHKAGGEI